ncbi:MAG: hypothetical protein HY774_27895 [Acidobacteria bacterium]|nr:hypothetical protein [Acidobacteriota bacterium]
MWDQLLGWLLSWLLDLLGGIQLRLWIGFLMFLVFYTLFTFWSYRFSIRSVGIREATYSQSICVRLVDLALFGLLFFTGWYFPLGIPLLLAARVLSFMIFFKAEFGKALLGVLLSLFLAVVFTILYTIFLGLWFWFFGSLPF